MPTFEPDRCYAGLSITPLELLGSHGPTIVNVGHCFGNTMHHAGVIGNNAVALWFDSHIRARRTLSAQEGDKMVAWGPALSLSVQSQLGSSMDMQAKPSLSGGEDATSARQSDSMERCQHPVSNSKTCSQPAVPCSDPRAPPTPAVCRNGEQDTLVEGLQLSVCSAEPSVVADSVIGSGKANCVGIDRSPGQNDSRRSSSTLEGSAADCKADSRMWERDVTANLSIKRLVAMLP
jgi:hypothetical protein